MNSSIDLDHLLQKASVQSVNANKVEIDGRQAIRVTLTEEASKGEPDIDYVDMPTFLKIPETFKNGIISVDLYSRLLKDAPDYARGFAGIAYRIQEDNRFESVYLRPLNGLKTNPEPPRNSRAVQYFAYPNWRYDRLRQEYPDGNFEAGADIAPSEWIQLKIVVIDQTLKVLVNDEECLILEQTKAEEEEVGSIGFFVDIGTEAFFSNLKVSPQN